MSNYAKQQPVDKQNSTMQNAPPAFPTLQSQAGVPVASSVLTFSQNTTVVDVGAFTGTAGSGGIIGKWGAASVTASNFDIFVNSGASNRYVVPVSVFGVTSSVVGANVANGLYTAISLKAATTQSSSVFTIEY